MIKPLLLFHSPQSLSFPSSPLRSLPTYLFRQLQPSCSPSPSPSLLAPSLLPLTQARTMARKKKGGRTQDPRTRMVRYSLNHPLTPRPLKFGYMRMLRHWTIHRAWMLFCRKRREEQERELERQYNKIRDACAELERTDQRLFRIATSKKGVGYFPIEMRIPTDTPPREGWNHKWKKA